MDPTTDVHAGWNSRWLRLLAVLVALFLVAAACDDDDDAGAGTPVLGVLSGAVEDGYAVDSGVPDSQIRRFDTTADMVDGLTAGRIDAFALTSVTVREQVADLEGFEATEGFVPVIDGEEQLGCGGYVFRFENKEFRDRFNQILTEMRENDELLPLVEEFRFGQEELDAAKGVTVEDLIGQPYDFAMEGEPTGNLLETAPTEGIQLGIADERPYGYQDPQTGQATGQAPTVATEVLSRMGIEQIDSSVVEFGALINGLNAERFDIIAAGMFITEERASQALFTDPDYCATNAFAVEEGNPHDIQRFEDFVPNGGDEE